MKKEKPDIQVNTIINEIIALQDEWNILFQKLNNSLAQLMRGSDGKKELAKYVLRPRSVRHKR
jgi:hypothetical protein